MCFYLDHVPEYNELIAKQSSILAFGLEGAESNLRPLLYCVQAWRPSYLKLLTQNIVTYANPLELEQNHQNYFEAGILQLSKHKSFDKNSFLYLSQKIQKNGLIIITGAKELGAASMYNWVSQYFAVADKYAKRHQISFILYNKPNAQFSRTQLCAAPIAINEYYQTQAGMFSHGKIDLGSQILREFFKENPSLLRQNKLKTIADFGAGWGYLSLEFARLYQDSQTIDLYETDYNSLQAARKAITNNRLPIEFNYYWLDIKYEAIDKKYDLIISNPPFHTARHADSELGQSFIEKAASALHPNGQLLIVANQHLPYENLLRKLFSSFSCMQIKQGYKILYAIK